METTTREKCGPPTVIPCTVTVEHVMLSVHCPRPTLRRYRSQAMRRRVCYAEHLETRARFLWKLVRVFLSYLMSLCRSDVNYTLRKGANLRKRQSPLRCNMYLVINKYIDCSESNVPHFFPPFQNKDSKVKIERQQHWCLLHICVLSTQLSGR